MKIKLLLISVIICLEINLLEAQSFTTPLPNYGVWAIPSQGTLSLIVPITNAGNPNLDVIIEKTVNNLAQHHSSYFCFGGANGTIGTCYDSTTAISGVFTFDGHSTQPLTADLNTNNALGISCVTYRIKDINNISDYSDVEICYYVTATGINNLNSASALSVPKPNPADKFTTLTYELKGNPNDYTLSIFNILGNKVQVNKFSAKSGILILPTSELTSGVYFYSLLEGSKVLSTNKLVVTHKN